MKVIGGEYAIDKLPGRLSGKENNKIPYSSGRCALYAILCDLEMQKDIPRKILLPDYLCNSITQTVMDAKWEYEFYHVSINFEPDIEKISQSGEKVILLINYFGMQNLQLYINSIRSVNADCKIIVDSVQAYYAELYENVDYTFYSYRKWFACPDGARIIKREDKPVREIPLGKNKFSDYKLSGNVIKGVLPSVQDEVFLSLLSTGENLLELNYLCNSSQYTREIFDSFPFDKIAEQRMENARFLHKKLDELQIQHLYSERSVPLFVPIMVPNRDCIKQIMFANQIFTPIHWPWMGDKYNGKNELYQVEISLICDQRYSVEDMERQILALEKGLGK